MTAAFFIILLGLWVLYSGWKFYRQVNWSDPTESKERRSGKERRHRHRRSATKALADSPKFRH